MEINDFTIKTKDNEFKIPKIFLILSSEYFKRKLYQNNLLLEENITQFNTNIIKILIKYLSFGSVYNFFIYY